MAESPTQLVHRAAGGVPRPGASRCWLCGGACDESTRVDDWLSDVFTDHSRVACPSSELVCDGCVFVCSRTSPVPGRPPKEGKEFGGNYRNYSHLYEQGWPGVQAAHYANASKGEKPLIRQFLSRLHIGPWFAAIADSGQKHVLPFAPMNGPGRSGRVAFDERIVVVPDDQTLVGRIADLLTAGATKEEVESGDYGARAYQLCGERLPAFEDLHRRERRSGWFTLALWLAQRDEEEVQRRMAAEKEQRRVGRSDAREVANANRRSDPVDPGGVPRKRTRKRAEALGSATGPNASGGTYDGDARRVGHGDLSEPAPAEPAQRELFGAR